MVFPSFTLRRTETSQEAIKRSDPKKGKKTIDASEDSTVPSMNNVFQVQAREVSEQVLPLDEVRENIEVSLLFEDDNVKGNVLEVREDSEDALPLDNTNVTDNVLEESDVQVDKGSDAFSENEQKGVKVEEELSELNSRMKTTVTKKKVRFKIPPDENEKKAKRTKFFGRKPVSKKTSSVIFIKAIDKKQESTREREILGLHEVSGPTIEKKADDSEAKGEKEGMSNCSIAVKSEKKGMSNRSMADDGKAPVSVMVEDVYTLFTEEASQACALIPDEALQAYDMIAKRAADTLSFEQLGDNVMKEGLAVSQSKQESKKANEQNDAQAREAPEAASNNEGEGAEDQEGAQASEEMDKVAKTKKFKDNAIQDEAVRAKEVTEKESVDQEKTQDQKPSSFKFIKATDKKQGSVREVLGVRKVSNETSTVKFIKAYDKKQRSVREMLGLREVSRAKNSKKKGATNRPIADDGKAPISLMVENVYASIVKKLSQPLQACDMFSEEILRSLFFFACLSEDVDASIVEKASQACSLIPEEALQAYDMIAKRAPHPLPLDQLGDSVMKEGQAVSQSKQEGEKAQEQNEARAREAPEETSNNEEEGAQDQEGAQAREETVKVIKSKMSRTMPSRTKLFGPKMLRAKKPPNQEMAQNQDVIEKSHARKESQVVKDSQDHENVEEEYFF